MSESRKPYIIFALPCYNEAQNIGPLLDDFIKLNQVYGSNFETRVVLINDASKDNTEQVAASYLDKLPLEIITHPQNKGLTGGINTSFQYFLEKVNSPHPPLGCGLMDGDNSHGPLNIPHMLDKILQGYDLVISSRFQLGARIYGVAWWRQVLSLGLAFLFKILRNIPGVRDYSCGYRLYSPSIVKKLKNQFPSDVVFEPSFASMVEVLVKCHLVGAICTEVPFLLRYDLKLGDSKMDFKRTIIGNFKLLWTLRKVESK